MDAIETVLFSGVSTLIGVVGILLYFHRIMKREGRGNEFNLFRILGLSTVCCMFLAVFVALGLVIQVETSQDVGRAFIYTGVYGSPVLAACIFMLKSRRTYRLPLKGSQSDDQHARNETDET